MILLGLVYDLPVVRQAIEFLTTSHSLPVTSLGRSDHISAKAIAQHIVSLNLFQVVDEVDRMRISHLREDFPVGVGTGNALFILVRTAVTSLGTTIDNGLGGEVLPIEALLVQNVKDLLNHPVSLSGLTGLEGGVGSGGTGRSLGADVSHDCMILFVLLISLISITKIQKIIKTTKFICTFLQLFS